MSGVPCFLQRVFNCTGIPQRIFRADFGLFRNGINRQEAKTFDPAKLKRICLDDVEAVVTELLLDFHDLLLRNIIRSKERSQRAQFTGLFIGVDDFLELALLDSFDCQELLRVIFHHFERPVAEPGNDGLCGFRTYPFDKTRTEIRYDALVVGWKLLFAFLNRQLDTITGLLPLTIQIDLHRVRFRQVVTNGAEVDFLA